MDGLKRLRPSSAMIVAVIALIAALSGGAIGATLITSGQVKDGSLTGADIKNGSVASADVKNKSLTGDDVKDKSLRTSDINASDLSKLQGDQGLMGAPGPQGPQGRQGPQGAQGPPGVVASYALSQSSAPIAPSAEGNKAVNCNPGDIATGGGFDINSAGVNTWALGDSGRVGSQLVQGWSVTAFNATTDTATFEVQVVCLDVTP